MFRSGTKKDTFLDVTRPCCFEILVVQVKSVLLCGSETRRLTSSNAKKLQSFVTRRLRYILGIFWPNKIVNDDLQQCTEQDKIEVIFRWRKRQWMGTPTNNTTRQALQWNPKEIIEENSCRRTSGDRHNVGADKKDIVEPSPMPGEYWWRPYAPVGVKRIN